MPALGTYPRPPCSQDNDDSDDAADEGGAGQRPR